jgi:ferredoxin
MQVFVDPEKCQGHLRCSIFAPEVFDVDNNGHAVVEISTVPPPLEGAVRKAIASCPEGAISIIDTPT